MMTDAVVVGAGPNGLAAAITLAEVGRSVRLLEAAETIGGGMRSTALTLPGFTHDVCSAIQPLAFASPVFRRYPLAAHGLEWVHPPVALAHPFDDGTAALLWPDLAATADGLGRDGVAWTRLFGPLLRDWERIAPAILAPIGVPSHPLAAGRFGVLGVRPAVALAEARFVGAAAKALFAGMAAHAFLPLDRPLTAGFGLVIGLLAHLVGWPLPRGGSQALADALASYLRSLGATIVTDAPVHALDDLPAAATILLDIGPHQFERIAGRWLSDGYRRRLRRFRYGPGVCKVDYALDGPVPWKADGCAHAGTVHLGGEMAEIAEGEAEVARGGHPRRPFVLVAQQSLFDETRAPEGKHTLWAYCHVPHGSDVDMSPAIEAQLERFAPGFGDRVLYRAVRSAAAMAAYNPNYVGGDVNGGMADLRQTFARPVARASPYATPIPGVYLCSASTPPGGGVHGMCGYHAARAALR